MYTHTVTQIFTHTQAGLVHDFFVSLWIFVGMSLMYNVRMHIGEAVLDMHIIV